MSFIYSQALVEASSVASCLATDASAQSSGSPMPRPSLWHDKTMEPSRLSRFGMTCKPLTEPHGAELLTWWLAAFPVRTYQWQGGGQALTESAAECGTTWPASLAKYDPNSHSLKTPQLSLLEDLTGCSVTLPRSGLMRGGECWERPTLMPHTSENESGFWLTPSASDTSNRKPPKNIHIGKAGLPKHIAADGTKSQMRLSQMVQMWPTPTGSGNYNRKGASATSGDGLATAVRLWPTPVASAAKGSSAASLTRKSGRSRERDRLDHAVFASNGGQLNPDWVEWLMGWPIGQTALKPLETDKCPEWQQQHSIY
jgi:hypothetical protein